MGERLRRFSSWMGLTADERYDQYGHADDELTEGVELVGEDELDDPRRNEPHRHDLAERHRGEEASVTTLAPRTTATTMTPSTTESSRASDMTRIVTVHPRTYNEARTVGEHFRDGVPVIMNLSDMEDSDAKRLVDFAAGLIFGARGSIERVTSKVFLLSPPNVNVTAEDKERIVGGFFNQS